MLTHHFTTTHSPSTLTALIATHHPDWQVCFLHNAHRPVIGICPKTAWQIEFDGTFITHRFDRHTGQTTAYATTYSDWQNKLIAYGKNLDCPSQKDEYTHGLMGFIGYDLSAHELNPNIAIKPNQPCAYFGHYDIYIKPCEHGFDLIGINADKDIFDEIKNSLTDLLNQQLPKPTPAQFISSWQKSNYNHAFNQTQEYIKAGDTYQINLTQKWQADLGNLASYLPHLQDKINAPFAGFLKLGEFEILSVSPELFFEFHKIENTIHIITKPIKGTRPRHDDIDIDNELKNELANSEKDISENLMIVDLLRNDLGKYAHIGTVKTPKRFAIETFKNVHHMVSTITAQLKDVHSLEVLFGSLPAGSITGTPKKRACEIIHELEISPRGAYCGTMGYMNFDGTGNWNVLIRTLQKWQKAELWAGGGITIKSDMESEYQECLDKVGNILQMIHDKCE
ncbi:anthranilate synthase component I family protein [Moraxella bovis]|uniref:Anthranilate synthase component I family protein n=1 Tax=Moraxella bovis TaxID=476 RepID=A0AAX3EU50_MORBO|nr:anthranilate synthase component I family protein [Moraxella bovis]AWY21388.1 anthranilate synthase component I family protein [Moraxella bovis]OOR89155.1 anthranilate synthase component I [Moraxella bovis]UYZ75574.1 anthranilate synthase component I family protein [Moraxella bovis]UYZ78484.1 anthranilate synthase component I family protein [Moraxella bovis]UYZ81371.1 anthranilate synthase component I family protein [Moraxella bovis]